MELGLHHKDRKGCIILSFPEPVLRNEDFADPGLTITLGGLREDGLSRVDIR